MKRLLVALVLLVALTVVACGTTTTTTTEAATTTTAPAVNTDLFADAWRALMEIQGATAVGVTYLQFGPLVQAYVTEISLLPEDLPAQDAEIATGLAEIAVAYIDSYQLWGKDAGGTRINLSRDGKYQFEGAERIVTVYNVKTETRDGRTSVYNTDGMKEIWAWASEHTETLRPLLAP
jgi:hypothetical protein